MRHATIGSVAVLLSLLYACGGQPAATEPTAGSALVVPNCPARATASPDSYVYEPTGQRKRYWGAEYESCPNVDSEFEFDSTPFEQALKSAGCINKTHVYPNNEIGVDCRASWEVALCPAGAAIDGLVKQYAETRPIKAQMGPNNGAINCSATNTITGRSVGADNPSPSAGKVVVKWDPSTDGSQPLVNATGTSEPAWTATGFNKCYFSGSSGAVYTDGRTCRTPQYVYPFYDNTRHCTSPNGTCL